MAAVHCSKCGEELMGAVNRCWRCGATFTSRPGPASVPPVRRAPIPDPLADPSAAAEARLFFAQAETASGQGGAEFARRDGAHDATANGDPTRRPGSPFASRSGGAPNDGTTANANANSAADPKLDAAQFDSPAPLSSYPRHAAALGGAIGSVVLGLMSLVGAYFTNTAIITSSIGLGMGVWGMNSQRRGIAILGLLLCCVALAISGFNGAVYLYEQMFHEEPF